MGFGGNLSEAQSNVRTCFVQGPVASVDWSDVARRRVTVDMLPDVALLRIYDFYVHETWEGAWYKLVHVCRKWRNLVFGSPTHLGLRLLCTGGTPVRKTLDVWPQLPIVIRVETRLDASYDVDDIMEALRHNDRTCRLTLFYFSSLQMERVLAALQQPFPALTFLKLVPSGETAPVDADSFLGGSAPPHLQTLELCRIPFPGLPKLLLSATHLVHLTLYGIPDSGYFSPEAMVTGLSALIRLETLDIRFKSPRSRPDRRRPPPQTLTLLPVLTELCFKGVSEYLEDLVARIDAPLLEKLNITFFHQLLFDTPQLALFINRIPKFQIRDKARVVFSDWDVWFIFPKSIDGRLTLEISCTQLDWQLSSLVQVCKSSFPPALISTVQHLYIEEHRGQYKSDDIDNIESSQWLRLLRPFTGVKHLYIPPKLTPSIAPVLQELVGERVTEVLPALKTLFLENLPSEPVQEAIEKFVSARQVIGHTIAVSRWVMEVHWKNILNG